MDGDPLYAPLSGRLCSWYQFRVERRETHYDNGKRRSSWATLEQGTSDDLFYLADVTGSCAIDPEGATVTPTHRNIWYGRSRTPSRYDAADASWWTQGMGRMGGQYRYTERRIEPGHATYAIGDFITHGGTGSRTDSGAQTAVLLREWKRDQTAMLARFDTNGDGGIDLQEWETARVAAAREVAETQSGAPAPPPVDVLAKTGDRQRPFIIAAGTEDQIVARYQRWATALLIIAIPLANATIWAAGIRFAA